MTLLNLQSILPYIVTSPPSHVFYFKMNRRNVTEYTHVCKPISSSKEKERRGTGSEAPKMSDRTINTRQRGEQSGEHSLTGGKWQFYFQGSTIARPELEAEFQPTLEPWSDSQLAWRIRGQRARSIHQLSMYIYRSLRCPCSIARFQ